LPAAIIGWVHGEVVKAINYRTFAGRLNDLSMVGLAGTPEALLATIRDYNATNGKIV